MRARRLGRKAVKDMNQEEYDFSQIATLFVIEKRNYQNKFNMQCGHYHDAYEIYYLLHGERTYFIRDQAYKINKGDLIFIKTNEIHKTINSSSNTHERILINFKKAFLEPYLNADVIDNIFTMLDKNSGLVLDKNSGLVHLDGSVKERVESILFWLLQEDEDSVEYAGITKVTLLFQLLLIIVREGFRNDVPVYLNSTISEKIFEIARYINNNYQDSISLEMLSKKFYISKSYLSRSFKSETGINITNYLNTVRIKEAQKLLHETDHKVSNISELVGYENLTHFERVFKSIVGQSATSYRKLY